MFVTRESDYAVRCVLMLARADGGVLSAREVARAAAVPPKFVATILHRLRRAGVVQAVRGAQGGYRLAKPATRVSLFDVIMTFQPSVASNVCAVEKRLCRLAHNCPVHPIWTELRNEAETRLKRTSFKSLAGTNIGRSRKRSQK